MIHIRSFGMLVSGPGMAALFQLLVTPVISRLYSPLEYGMLVLLVSLASIPSVIATLQIHQGILIETTPDAEFSAVKLCLVSTIAMAAIMALISGALVLVMPTFAQNELINLGGWLFLMPIATFQSGLSAISISLANRPRHYRFITITQAISAIVPSSIAILIGIYEYTSSGLLFGYATGLGVQILFSGAYMLYRFNKFKIKSSLGFRDAFLRHHRFALFTMPSELLLAITNNLPIYALGLLGFQRAAGEFGGARQISLAPVNIIINAVGHIFRREALDALEARGECKNVVLSTAGIIFGVGAVGVVPFFLYAPEIFKIYLGPSWDGAGEIAQILIPMLVLRMTVSPVSTVLWLVNAQRVELILSMLSIAAMIAGVTIGYLITKTAIGMVYGYSISYSILYLITLSIALKAAGKGRLTVREFMGVR